MHKANLLEAYSVIYKDQGRDKAIAFYNDLMTSPIRFYNTMTPEFFDTFHQIRAQYKLPFIDTFVAATNVIHAQDGTIVTADRDFANLSRAADTPVIFFR
jgi:predicted nucleic acid-binding protein